MADTVLNNRYRLIAQQGSGGMSVIYKAIDEALGRTVALKILRPSLTQDPAFLEKFHQEARSVANLAHPNIVTVHDVGNDGPTHYIVMEMIEGEDLKKIIKATGALPIDRAVDLAIQICAGIGFAHRSGLVHADVKPQNVLLTKDNVVKITDFGIAQAFSDTMPQTRQDVVWGSPHYFAPEQATGQKPTPASDVYAIGIVLFEMLTGHLPYVGTNQQELAMAHIKQAIPRASAANPSVPESLSRIVYKVMGKKPSDRYRMADQLGHVLQGFRDRARGMTAENSPVSPPPPPAKPPTVPQTVPNQRIAPPSPQVSPSAHNEPTLKYSAAPEAPQPYDPRRTAVPSASTSSPPQPLQQNMVPSPPQQPVSQDSGRYYATAYRNTLPQEEEGSGLDLVTIVLAILAFIAVAGLVPLYILAFQSNI